MLKYSFRFNKMMNISFSVVAFVLLGLLLQDPLRRSADAAFRQPSFVVVSSSRSTTTTATRGRYSFALGPVIQADDTDFLFDMGQGGVSLAEESAIQIIGDVKHKPGKANPKMHSLQRFTKLTPVSEKQLQDVLTKVGGSVVTTGIGKELYKDPGETTVNEVTYGPDDAVRDALNAAGSAIDIDHVVINFAGGNKLQVLEVLDAVQQMVLMLDVNTKSNIDFSSLCHFSFEPETSVSVTVINVPQKKNMNKKSTKGDGDENEPIIMTNFEKPIADGHVYCWDDGKSYYTVVQDDLNTAVA